MASRPTMESSSHLGEVNVEFGHNVGTELISRVGDRLVHDVESEAVCRYAGGEFVLVLRGTAADSRALLQTCFLERLPESAPESPAKPRASIGIASSPADGNNAESLFKAAHAALSDSAESGGEKA